jgi:hypothetical protein
MEAHDFLQMRISADLLRSLLGSLTDLPLWSLRPPVGSSILKSVASTKMQSRGNSIHMSNVL